MWSSDSCSLGRTSAVVIIFSSVICLQENIGFTILWLCPYYPSFCDSIFISLVVEDLFWYFLISFTDDCSVNPCYFSVPVKEGALRVFLPHHLPITLILNNIPSPYPGFPCGSGGKESTCNAGDLGLIPELGRCPEEGNSYPLQYSGLENSTDRGAWQATVHGVAESKNTWLSYPHTFTLFD